jgi:DNA modification methylase
LRGRRGSAPVGGSSTEPPNLLAYGDNLTVLSNPEYVATESVDLIYLDPPFNSNVNYNVLFSEHGVRAAAQIKAFEDTWEWNTESARAYQETVEQGGPVASALHAFRIVLGDTDMLAYLSMMAPRLVAMRRVLKPTGSLYLHADPNASHYLKVLLDKVFGPKFFRNEIVWKRTTAHSGARKYAPIHDTILYYGNGKAPVWNDLRTAYDPAYLDKYYRFDDGDGRLYWRADLCAAGVVRHGSSGKPWRGIDPSAKGMHWKFGIETLDRLDTEGRIYWPPRGTMPQYKRYRDELKGKAVPDIWDDIDRINPVGSERRGFPTQKPVALLKRIIEASSNEGDVVLDPFCGCGTSVEAAIELRRNWIGIDITHLAIGHIKNRLVEKYGPAILTTFRTVGEPTTVEDAVVLAKEDPFQFQAWALGLVGARIATSSKKGGDEGVDGRLFFHDRVGAPSRQVVFSVKGRQPAPTDVRDLISVIYRENADIGVFISLHKPSPNMYALAESVGHPDGVARVQLRTIDDLLTGRGIDYPIATFEPRTFWPPEMIPTKPRAPRPPRRKRPAPRVPVVEAHPLEVPESDQARLRREEYERRAAELAEEYGQPLPSPEAPLSARTSRRDR